MLHGDLLSSVGLDGVVRWTVALADISPPAPIEELEPDDEWPDTGDAADDGPPEPPGRLQRSLPTALTGGRVALAVENGVVIVDADGRVVDRVTRTLIDDTGLSLNVSATGTLLLPTSCDGTYAWDAEGLRKIAGSGRGYDQVAPAVFADDSLGIADYAGDGYLRVALGGGRIWTANLRDADQVPTVARAQRSAVGSANDGCSIVVSKRGETIGVHPHAAVFAEYSDGGWIAQSDGGVARLDERGAQIWRVVIDVRHRGVDGPIVDLRGAIYVHCEGSLVTLDQHGRRLWSLRLGRCDGPVFPAGPGRFAVVVDGALRFMG
ncbi:hypothetical protein [Nannocystis sp. SCPEA4]|uniref:hypothetical protein n=1 Tax=Nannocystis sp. SCPEA4 TaxID=2996787 RepID=UPI002271B233|nr:hypothetical protein [Nannocystis sp. SCPEA4]MCY1060004.1 hypothetical protein [Nannocystis sp. SCPEA4]